MVIACWKIGFYWERVVHFFASIFEVGWGILHINFTVPGSWNKRVSNGFVFIIKYYGGITVK